MNVPGKGLAEHVTTVGPVDLWLWQENRYSLPGTSNECSELDDVQLCETQI